MGCDHPMQAFRTGFKTDNGKDDYIISSGIVSGLFDVSNAKKPVLVGSVPHKVIHSHVYLTDPVEIPCGKCVGCRMAAAKEWKIRNCLELQAHPAYFVTLTFDDEHLPVNECGEPIVDYAPVQAFLKRFRKSYGECRFFGCMEYGEHTRRPHAHLLLYTDLHELYPVAPSMFFSPEIEATWKQGFHTVEQVTPSSVAYVCGYVEKKQCDPNWFDYPAKPFLFMSRKPGIGMLDMEKYRKRFEYDQHVYGRFSEDIKYNKYGIPKAFKRRIQDEAYYQRIHDDAVLAGMKAKEVSMVVYKPSHPARLGDCMDASKIESLEKVRKGKL